MTDQTPAPTVPAGWYPDGVNGQRYWDGNAWTNQRAPLAPQKRGNVPAVLALVFGVLSALVGFLGILSGQWGFGVALIFALPAIVLAIVGLALSISRRTGRAASIWALVAVISPIPIWFVIRLLFG